MSFHNEGLLVAAQQGKMLTLESNDHLKGDSGLVVSAPSESLAPTATFQTISVVLQPEDIAFSIQGGMTRHLKSVKDGRKDKAGLNPDKSIYVHRMGALGECAVSRALNIPWDCPVDVFSAPDVGIYHVRWTSTGSLITRPSDTEKGWSAIFICVTGKENPFILNGWARLKETRQADYFTSNGNNRPPAWFYPIEKLHPMSTLPIR